MQPVRPDIRLEPVRQVVSEESTVGVAMKIIGGAGFASCSGARLASGGPELLDQLCACATLATKPGIAPASAR